MRRLALSLLLISSCAHMTEPVSPAPNLLALIESLEPNSEPAPPTCPDWVKLDGVIDADSAAKFGAEMKACADRAVVVEINSPGGSVFDAIEMQKAIERHPHPVYCVVDGVAASAAFVTLQSCDFRLMTDRSVLMAHHAAIPRTGGQEEPIENAAAALRALDHATALHCARRMGITPEAYEAHVSGGREWWLPVDDATKEHAVDLRVTSVADAVTMARESDSKT